MTNPSHLCVVTLLMKQAQHNYKLPVAHIMQTQQLMFLKSIYLVLVQEKRYSVLLRLVAQSTYAQSNLK